MGMESWLCSLAEARREADPKTSGQDAYLTSLIPSVSGEIENALAADFEPIREIRPIPLDIWNLSPDQRTLKLRMDGSDRAMWAAEIYSLTIDSKLISTSEYEPINNPTFRPSNKLRLKRGCGVAGWRQLCRCPDDSPVVALIDATWVFRERYAVEGWQSLDTLDVVTSGTITPSEAELTLVGTTMGFGYDGLEPRFSPGMLLRIGAPTEDLPTPEVTRVIEADYETDGVHTVTVLRGQKGTEKGTYTTNQPLFAWSVQPEPKRAAVRWAVSALSTQGTFETQEVTGVGILQKTIDMPKDTRLSLRRFANAKL